MFNHIFTSLHENIDTDIFFSFYVKNAKFWVFLKFSKSKIKEKLEFKEKKSYVKLRKNLWHKF
jgi:hypothetical protein